MDNSPSSTSEPAAQMPPGLPEGSPGAVNVSASGLQPQDPRAKALGVHAFFEWMKQAIDDTRGGRETAWPSNTVLQGGREEARERAAQRLLESLSEYQHECLLRRSESEPPLPRVASWVGVGIGVSPRNDPSLHEDKGPKAFAFTPKNQGLLGLLGSWLPKRKDSGKTGSDPETNASLLNRPTTLHSNQEPSGASSTHGSVPQRPVAGVSPVDRRDAPTLMEGQASEAAPAQRGAVVSPQTLEQHVWALCDRLSGWTQGEGAGVLTATGEAEEKEARSNARLASAPLAEEGSSSVHGTGAPATPNPTPNPMQGSLDPAAWKPTRLSRDALWRLSTSTASGMQWGAQHGLRLDSAPHWLQAFDFPRAICSLNTRLKSLRLLLGEPADALARYCEKDNRWELFWTFLACARSPVFGLRTAKTLRLMQEEDANAVADFLEWAISSERFCDQARRQFNPWGVWNETTWESVGSEGAGEPSDSGLGWMRCAQVFAQLGFSPTAQQGGLPSTGSGAPNSGGNPVVTAILKTMPGPAPQPNNVPSPLWRLGVQEQWTHPMFSPAALACEWNVWRARMEWFVHHQGAAVLTVRDKGQTLLGLLNEHLREAEATPSTNASKTPTPLVCNAQEKFEWCVAHGGSPSDLGLDLEHLAANEKVLRLAQMHRERTELGWAMLSEQEQELAVRWVMKQRKDARPPREHEHNGRPKMDQNELDRGRGPEEMGQEQERVSQTPSSSPVSDPQEPPNSSSRGARRL